MPDRGSFDPTEFVAADPDSWPQAPGGSLLDDDDETVLVDDDGTPLGTDIPWYRAGDTWTVTRDGRFRGVKVRAGGRLVVRS